MRSWEEIVPIMFNQGLDGWTDEIVQVIYNIDKSGFREVKMDHRIISAHHFCTNNKAMLLHDNKCGCFFCLSIFAPAEINEWIQGTKETALCPFCGIDSVIGESSGYPITKDFLSKMKEYWF